MSKVVLGILGVAGAGVGGYFLWKHFQSTQSTVGATPGSLANGAAPPATPVNYTPPSGGPSTQDQIASAVGGVGGLAAGTYLGGPVGGILGAKVGQVIAPVATKVAVADVKGQVTTQLSAVRGLAGGVADIAKGNVVSGTKAVVTNGLKSAAAPVTSAYHAISSLF